jgi:hypothetical protein
MVWGCFAGDTVCDVFRIQGTLNQHDYHSNSAAIRHPIWFVLSETINCFSRYCLLRHISLVLLSARCPCLLLGGAFH